MTRDVLPDRSRPEPPAPGRMVVAGVAGAVLLGVALGFWARPAEPGKPSIPVAARLKPAPPPRPSLQVVIDEAPAAPIGEALEVLPADTPPARPLDLAPPMAQQAPVLIEPVVPRRPPSGLVKVDALSPVVGPPVRSEPTTAPARRPKVLIQAPKADTRQVKARADAKPTALAKLRADNIENVRVAKRVKAEKARAVKPAEAATHPLHKAGKGTMQTAERAKPSRPAVKPVKVAKTEANRIARPKPVKVAAAKPAPKPERKPAAKRPVRGSDGSRRVARARPCALSDPGEAIVCADRSLGQRDRQLQAAYRSAEAAGVPAAALRRQQSRWLAARAAAAREAPWAVEDVYVARISELKDQTRDAREN